MDIFEAHQIKKSDFVSIRSRNYLVLKSDVVLSETVAPYLQRYLKVADTRGKLFVYESNFTPLRARGQFGINGTLDLEEELAIQQFIGTLEIGQFRMVRVGDEWGARGTWSNHDFRKDPDVDAIEYEYSPPPPDHGPGSDF